MGLLGGILRGKESVEVDGDPSKNPPGSSSVQAEMLKDAAPSTSMNTGASRLYDPYEGLSQAVGGRKLVFQLPEGPEFVFQEEVAVHRRTWGENLQYYTGMGYLSGGSTGVAAGAYLAMRQKPEFGNDTLKLMANRLLNTSGAFGRRCGNSAGILGLYFSAFESYLLYKLDSRVPDTVVTSMAGFTAAALFRSTRGVRPAAVAGVVGALAGGALAAARQRFPSL